MQFGGAELKAFFFLSMASEVFHLALDNSTDWSKNMAEVTEDVINSLSGRLREWVHEVNNAVFVARGFLEEIQEEIQSRNYQKNDFDHENLVDMIETVGRNVERIDTNLQKLRKLAKEDIFVISGLKQNSA